MGSAHLGFLPVITTDTHMLQFNKLTFAPHGTELSDTDHGFYKRSEVGVHLYKRCGSLEAFIVNNPRQGKFIVSATDREGHPRYLHSTSSLTERWLGMEGRGLLFEHDSINAMKFTTEESPEHLAAPA